MTSRSLTKHGPGTVAEIAAISLPLMLAVLSTSLMMFVDRLMLARFSTEAMNASVAAGATVALWQYGVIGVASIVEVFVGRLNGEGRYRECGRPVWQMLYLSLFSLLLFLPVACWGGGRLISQITGGAAYFRTLMFFGPFFPASAALSAFFVGIGRVKTITLVTIGANVLNIGLDRLLIFGFGPVAPGGTFGAALATGIAQTAQIALLILLFLRHQMRVQYGTGAFAFDRKALWECLRLGVPVACGHMVEIGAWTFQTQLLLRAGVEYVTVQAIGQSVFALFHFVCDGLQKGVTAVVANYLGAGSPEMIRQVAKSAIILLGCMVGVLAIPLLFMPGAFVGLFLPDASHSPEVARHAAIALGCVWGYFLLDGLVWILAGVLTAGGDTQFVMATNGLTAWLFALVPTYVAISILKCGPCSIWALALVYAACNLGFFYMRYRAGGWKRAALA